MRDMIGPLYLQIAETFPHDRHKTFGARPSQPTEKHSQSMQARLRQVRMLSFSPGCPDAAMLRCFDVAMLQC